MDIDILEPERSASDDGQETLERIQLYSSGNWGPLYHWGSEEGLQKRGKVNMSLPFDLPAWIVLTEIAGKNQHFDCKTKRRQTKRP